jgi:glycine hydroxymethyltransferase
MILCKTEHAQAIDKAVFPGIQGGPHNHTTAGIAVALKEAMADEFKEYAAQIVTNAKTMADELSGYGFDLVTGGTENHLLLIDLTNKNVTGKQAAKALDKAGLVLNCNSVPYDKRKPFDPSGIRLGLAAVTSRGFKDEEVKQIAKWMNNVIDNFEDESLLEKTAQEVKELCRKFPPPGLPIK